LRDGRVVHRLRSLFLNENEHRLRPGWRFVLFLTLYLVAGDVLNRLLLRIHFPDRTFTWSGLLLNYLVDFAFVAALAWIMSRIEHERFSSYGLPLVRGAGRLFLKGVLWGLVPSAAILIPIYLAGGCSFHGLALHGRDLVFYGTAWALAMLALGFGEEFLFRGYALKTLAESIGFWPAAIILSSLFGLVHLIFKPHEDWIDPISVGLYGVFWALTLRRTGSLWFAVGFHAASDYADMVLFAEPNSGNDGKPLTGHLLDIRFHGPDWLTGGPRGTEASLLVFVILAGLFYLFNRGYPTRQYQPEATTDLSPAAG
jgi:membrane protease YdiL (CAAX protease family)